MYSEEEQMYSNNGVNGAGGPEAALDSVLTKSPPPPGSV